MHFWGKLLMLMGVPGVIICKNAGKLTPHEVVPGLLYAKMR